MSINGLILCVLQAGPTITGGNFPSRGFGVCIYVLGDFLMVSFIIWHLWTFDRLKNRLGLYLSFAK